MAYKTGVHRVAVAVRAVSWLWLAVGVVAVAYLAYIAYPTGPRPEDFGAVRIGDGGGFLDVYGNAITFLFIFGLSGAAGLGLAWIIDGFALKEGKPQT